MATYRALLSIKSSLDDPDSRLSALRLLNLSNNVFNRTFPPELSNLTNLRVLDLYNNNLTGVLPVSVATFHYYTKQGNPVIDRRSEDLTSACIVPKVWTMFEDIKFETCSSSPCSTSSLPTVAMTSFAAVS
ncbi:hypothetical protein ACLB2K_052610 [Fragaria x ananassa]